MATRANPREVPGSVAELAEAIIACALVCSGLGPGSESHSASLSKIQKRLTESRRKASLCLSIGPSGEGNTFVV